LDGFCHHFELQLEQKKFVIFLDQNLDYCKNLMEKEINIGEVFEQDECIDTAGISKGHGTEGVITRLPRKTHTGLKKVNPVFFSLCIFSPKPQEIVFKLH